MIGVNLMRVGIGWAMGGAASTAQTPDAAAMRAMLADHTRTSIRLVPTWSGVFGVEMAGDVLLPEPDARIAPTTFDDWLAGETRS